MLVIRLQRTGRRNQVAYRIVVAEHSAPVKGRVVDSVGMYNPSEQKKITFDAAVIEDWISKGAKPSDTVASLLKANGMKGMEKFVGRRDLKRDKKNPSEEELAAMEAAKNPAPAAEEAPAEEAAAPAEEAPAETEAPTEETPAEEPAEEAAAEESAE